MMFACSGGAAHSRGLQALDQLQGSAGTHEHLGFEGASVFTSLEPIWLKNVEECSRKMCLEL